MCANMVANAQDYCWMSFNRDPVKVYYEVTPDTAADVTTISLALVKQHPEWKIVPPDNNEQQVLIMADGRRIPRYGYVVVDTTFSFETGYYPPLKLRQQFEVIDCEEACLMGKDLLQKVFPLGEHLYECIRPSPGVLQVSDRIRGLSLPPSHSQLVAFWDASLRAVESQVSDGDDEQEARNEQARVSRVQSEDESVRKLAGYLTNARTSGYRSEQGAARSVVARVGTSVDPQRREEIRITPVRARERQLRREKQLVARV
jgi:hypothetical protein